MEPPDDRTYYSRLEALERGMERVHAILAEHSRRIDGVEQIAAKLGHIEALLARLEERLSGLNNGFLDPAYLRIVGSEHPGVDLNRAGTSGDADLGHPILCLAPGVVEEVAQDDVWGNVVLVRHDAAVARYVGRILGREIPALWSQYAHLTLNSEL